MRVPQKVTFAVAEMFWDYLNKTNNFPETRTQLSRLYTQTFRPNIIDAVAKRVSFGSLLFSLREIGVVQRPRRRKKEDIVYNASGRRVPARENRARRMNDVTTAAIGGFAALEEKLKSLDKYRWRLAQNKGNITIEPVSDKIGVLDMGEVRPGEKQEVKFIVRNESSRKHLFGSVVLGSTTDFNVDNTRYEFMGKELNNMAELVGHGTTEIPVTIEESTPGVFQVVVAFWFRCGKGDPFHIVKFVKISVRDHVVDDLEPTVPYNKPKVTRFNPDVELVKGEPLPCQGGDFKVNLKRYPVPRKLRDHFKEKTVGIYLETFIPVSNPEKEHCERLSVLLHVEELQMEEDIQMYNMESEKLSPVGGGFLALRVPGLAENRPSLMRGDRLFVRKIRADGRQEEKEYEGYVHRIERDEVHLKFSAQFHGEFVKNMLFAVRFSFRRTSLRLMHRALEQAPSFLKMIPPCPERCPHDQINVSVTSIRFYNKNVGNNEEQKKAVENIVAGTSGPYPYLVFGPPGTGKTVTMVEAINQVLNTLSGSKILACAPSNSAADLLLERVADQKVVPRDRMVRLNALGRLKSAVNPKVMDFCKSDGEFFCFPTREEIMKYRLVVTTLISAGRLVSLGIDRSHFTHIFIDEAGQGMEPESFVAVAGLIGTDKAKERQVVLAGDPKQLGPVLRSRFASGTLGVSLLERLMSQEFACYNRLSEGKPDPSGVYDTKMVSKLLNNYRSHPEIIKVPNEIFYDGELRACADVLARESLCQWDGLPVKGFPVIFEGVNGQDKREKKSPSFFNPYEVTAVLRYVKSLKEARSGGVNVETKDIGIISPYNQQVQKIREKLRGRPYDIRDIKVGSVEEFQGQERRVIIISTVRSSEEFLYHDARFRLGFLKNPKRFNVAITRAKALLIVIGNPHVLCRDEQWRKFIGFCQEIGSYIGCAFEMPDINDEVLEKQLSDLELDDAHIFCKPTDAEDPECKPPAEE